MQDNTRSTYALGALSEADGSGSSGNRLDFRGEKLHAYSPGCVILASSDDHCSRMLTGKTYSYSIQLQIRRL